MRSGANVISHIAAIEITRGEWVEIVDILAHNISHSELSVRKASIITISNIC
jgi:hypothetical protein